MTLTTIPKNIEDVDRLVLLHIDKLSALAKVDVQGANITQLLASALKLHRQGTHFARTDNLDDAFVILLRFITLMLEVIPKQVGKVPLNTRPEYDALRAKAVQAIDECEKLKDRIKVAKRDALMKSLISRRPRASITPSPTRSEPALPPISQNPSSRSAATLRALDVDSSLLNYTPSIPQRTTSLTPHERSASPLSPSTSHPNEKITIKRPPQTANGLSVPKYHRNVQDRLMSTMSKSSYQNTNTPPARSAAGPESMIADDKEARKRRSELTHSYLLNTSAWGYMSNPSDSSSSAPYSPMLSSFSTASPPQPNGTPSIGPSGSRNESPPLPPKPSILEPRFRPIVIADASPGIKPITLRENAAMNTPKRQPTNITSPTAMTSISRAFTDFRFTGSESQLSQSGRGVCGLKNLGNSCYQNSVLQCLNGTVPLIRFFASGQFKAHINGTNALGSGGKVSFAFFNLIQDMLRNSGTFVAPVTFRDTLSDFAPQFANTDQQDGFEFLGFLLDGLHEDLKAPKPNSGSQNPAAARSQPLLPGQDLMALVEKPNKIPDNDDDLEGMEPHHGGKIAWDRYLMKGNASFMVELLHGQTRSQLRCTVCGTTSSTYSPFNALSVPVPARRGFANDGFLLEQCLDEYLRSEILDGDNAWRCSKCKQMRRSERTVLLTRLPPVLIIHLKRFSYEGIFRDKLTNLVKFPLHALDLNEYLGYPHGSENYQYDLYGVVNHYGGLDGGHYTAVVNHNNRWHTFDDSRVSPCDERTIVTYAAYMLFYVRRNELMNSSKSSADHSKL